MDAEEVVIHHVQGARVRSLPTPYLLSSGDGAEDGEEWIIFLEARGVDGGAQVICGIGGPFCAISLYKYEYGFWGIRPPRTRERLPTWV